EQIYPVSPLAVPNGEGEDPWSYGAVTLFAARSRSSGAHLAEDPSTGLAVASICRQLDGIPLAIELAAARAAALGIAALGANLDDRFSLLTGGRRTALPRHRTLRATLDWSFEFLSEPERAILRRLAVFAGAFSLDAACAVAADAEIAPSEVVDGLSSLIAKSLVATGAEDTPARFRLLDTTRAYALEKLTESGEGGAVSRRHAEYYRDLLQAAAEDTTSVDDPRAGPAAEIDNVRAALAWAFGPEGDTTIGVALGAAAVPIWFEMSLLTECCMWTEKALGVLDAAGLGTNQEMVLQYALGCSLMFARGMNDRAYATLTRARELAEHHEDLTYQLRTLAGLAAMHQRFQDYQGAVALGRRAEELVKGSFDPIALSFAEWILGSSLQLLGEYPEALTYAQRAYAHTAIPAARRAHIARLGRDGFVSAGSTMAIILWAQGLPDQSAQAARNVLADAEAGNHPVSLCLALTWCGCIIPLRLGDMRTAQRSIARLKDHARNHGLSAYYANGLCFEGQLAAKRGDLVAAERLLREGLKNLRQTRSETFYTVSLTGLAEVLTISAESGESLAAAEEAVQRAERANALWWMPEALRIKGEALLSCNGDTNAAEDHFRRSLDLAHRQGALSWELRAGTSLARLLRDQGHPADAEALLQPIYDRFTEGFDTADLKAAEALLDRL
ncbi:MAG TPA: hypothetical protein VMU01_03100, partial [Rhizomicrobium sp.]|nr:hypothetical protein [Rhizomicrobium sp.]